MSPTALAATGHTVGDIWTETVTTANVTMLSLDAAANVYGIGDILGVVNKTRITINDLTKRILATNIPEYLNNAAAIAGGEVVDTIYRTTVGGDAFLKVVI